MLTFREIAQDLEGVRNRLKNNITNEDIDVIFDLLKNFYKQTQETTTFTQNLLGRYKKLYQLHHNIPGDAIVEWNF